MATILIEDTTVVIQLSPIEKFFSLHGSLKIPLTHVIGAEVDTENPWHLWLRAIGTNFPGLRTAGTFVTPDGWVFCDFSDGKACVSLRLQHEFYKRAIIQLDKGQDAAQVVAELETARAKQP